jgi:glycosyltransferase involved in cell wall biosynthesis
MKVLVVSVVHTPFDARIHHRQIRALRAEGVAVTQVAPWSATGCSPDGGVEGVNGVDVPRAQGRRRLHALRAARNAIRVLGPDHDLVLLHDPELVLAVVGRLRKLPPVVLDVHEDMAASLPDRRWMPDRLHAIAVLGVRHAERWAENHLASLLLAEEGYRARFRGDHPIVPNLPWRSATPDCPVDASRVVCVGRISTGRGALELIAIAEQLAAQDGPHLELVGAADGDVAPLIRAAAARGILDWHGFVPNNEAMTLIQGALAGLAPLHDLPNYRVSMPTKVVEYLAQGVPAIVTPLPSAARIVTEAEAGYVVPFKDVIETVAAIRQLQNDPTKRAQLGAAGKAYIDENASWDISAPRFVDHLRAVADQRTAKSAS